VSFGRILKRKQPAVDQPVMASTASRSLLLASLLPQPRTTASGLMTEDEAAKYLADRMPNAPAARTLRRWRTDPRFKGVGPTSIDKKPARHVWYSRDSLDAWIENKNILTAA
jgi:hypothetical protein